MKSDWKERFDREFGGITLTSDVQSVKPANNLIKQFIEDEITNAELEGRKKGFKAGKILTDSAIEDAKREERNRILNIIDKRCCYIKISERDYQKMIKGLSKP